MTSLTSLSNVKDWLGIPSDKTSDDALLTLMIGRASSTILNELGRPNILSQSYTEVRDGLGMTRMVLRNWPLRSVSSVTVDGTAIAAQTSVPLGAGYMFQAWNGLVPGRAAWIDLVGYAFTVGRSNVQIVYTAGYDTVPEAIESACIELIALRYKERQRIGQTSVSTGQQTIQFVKDAYTDSILQTLEAFRQVAPL